MEGDAYSFMQLIQAQDWFADAAKFMGLMTMVMLRFQMVVMIVPVFMPETFSGPIRGAFVMLMSAFVAFGMPLDALQHVHGITWFVLLGKEVLVGIALGYALATPFWTAECVGALYDMQSGFNNVQHTNPLSGEESTPVSQMLLFVTVGVFCASGGLLLIIGTMVSSFAVWPVDATLPSLKGLAMVFLPGEVDSLMGLIVRFAAPVLIALLLVDLGIGFVTRSADKLEPNSLSQPIKGAVVVLMLALLLGLFIEQLVAFIVPNQVIERIQHAL